MVAFVEPRAVEIGQGITLSVHEQGEGPAVVLCHGFPELASCRVRKKKRR